MYSCKYFFITIAETATLLILSIVTAYDFTFSSLSNYKILFATVVYAVVFSFIIIPLGFVELLRGEKVVLHRKIILFIVLYVGTSVYSFLLLYIFDKQLLDMPSIFLNLIYVSLLIMEPNILD